MYTVYEVNREGKELPESQWVKVVGVIEYGEMRVGRYTRKTADVLGKDGKPLLAAMERAVVVPSEGGRFAITGEQRAAHQKGLHWQKVPYPQVWLCVPVRDEGC